MATNFEGPKQNSKYPDMNSIATLASWCQQPFEQVGSSRGGLNFYDKCSDRTTLFEDSFQQYTSHLSLSSSYVSSLTVSTTSGANVMNSNTGVENQPANAKYRGIAYIPTRNIKPMITTPRSKSIPTPYTHRYPAMRDMAKPVQSPLGIMINSPVHNRVRSWFDNLSDCDECRDVAAMARTALLARALDAEAAQEDITPATFLRNMERAETAVSITLSRERAVPVNILAMPLRTFTDFLEGNQFNDSLPAQFRLSGMDESWIGIPVGNHILNSDCLPLYIASFLSSTLTWGTITHRRDAVSISDFDYKAAINTIPAANTAFIKGHTDAILILTDFSAYDSNTSICVAGCKINVFTGAVSQSPQASHGQPHEDRMNDVPDFWPHWQTYYTGAGPTVMAKRCRDVWELMANNQAVANTPGMALSLASELSLAIRPGMLITPYKDKIGLGENYTLTGGYQLANKNAPDRIPISPGSKFHFSSLKWQTWVDGMDIYMHGFNNASVSSLHIPPTGFANVMHAEGLSFISDKYPTTSNYCNMYTTLSATTPKRLAIALKLIETTTTPYKFATADAMSGWMHMCAHAMAASTSVMLTLNHIPMRDWAGYNTSPYNVSYGRLYDMKNLATHGMVQHFEVKSMYDSFNLYDEYELTNYYFPIDPYKNRIWGSHSPVPAHLTIQWMEKLKLGSNSKPPSPKSLEYIPRIKRFGTEVSPASKTQMLYALSTFDVTQYIPALVTTGLLQESGMTSQTYGLWVDQHSHLTMTYSGVNRMTKRDLLATNTITEHPQDLLNINAELYKMYICDTILDALKCFPMDYPASPSFLDVINSAKKYLVMTDLAEFIGISLATPVGAAAVGTQMASGSMQKQ